MPAESKLENFDLEALYNVILDRQKNPRPSSYTNFLLAAGTDEISKKVGEEAIEIILAVKGQGRQRVIAEIADLTYHVLALMVDQGLAPVDILRELAARHLLAADE